MRRLLATATLLAALVAAWALASPASAQPPSKRVILVLAPYLTWEDLTATSTPTIWSLAETGAIGDINSRSRTRLPGEPPSPLEGALTISAGAWAVPSADAAAAYRADEPYEVGTAAEAFRRTTGEHVGKNRIVFLGMPITQSVNSERSFDAVIGLLGQTVVDAGGVTGAIGNSDVGYVTAQQRRVRPAALSAMDEDGLVALGDVSTRMLREDPSAPFGFKTDLKAFDRALGVLARDSVDVDGPSLIVLDAGDAYRAVKFEPQVTPEIAVEQRVQAMSTLDSVVELARRRFPNDVVVIASQSTGTEVGRPDGLGPIVISGAGWSGYLTSDSTQRPGLVTNLDVTATALKSLGLPRPVKVLGNPMRTVAAPANLEARVAFLDQMNRTAVAFDSAKPRVVNAFVALTVIVLLLGAVVLVRARYWGAVAVRRWVTGLRIALLAVLSLPAASWLLFGWWRWPVTVGQAVGALLATSVAILAVGCLLMLRAPMRVPVAALSLLTSAVIVVDQWLGAPASFTNFFGYSPLLAARFYGMGNEAAAMLFGSSIVGIALLFDEWPDSRWTTLGKRAGIPLLAVIVLSAAAAPFWGANIGVAIWGVVGFGLAWVLMNGHHVSGRTVLWLFFTVVVVILGFAAIDLFSGGPQTHLGRALTSAEQGGWIELWNIVARKAETNMRVLTHTNWAYILVATLAFLGFMRWRPQGDFAGTLSDNPDFADAITVSLVAGLVAYFTEDSGIVIPALEVFYVGVAVVWLMLARLLPRREPNGEEAGEGTADKGAGQV